MRQQFTWRTRFEKACVNTEVSQQCKAFKTLTLVSNFWIGWLIDHFVGVPQSANSAINCLWTNLHNRLLLYTFIMNVSWFYKKTHCNPLRTQSTLHRLLSLWLTAYVRVDFSRHAGLPLFCFSMQVSIFATYRLFGSHHSWYHPV